VRRFVRILLPTAHGAGRARGAACVFGATIALATLLPGQLPAAESASETASESAPETVLEGPRAEPPVDENVLFSGSAAQAGAPVDEDELFADADVALASADDPERRDEASRDADLLSAGRRTAISPDAAPSDPLEIGGQLFMQARTSATQGQAFEQWSLSAPALLDVYLDARPNDRLRAFAQGRMSFDPTLPPAQSDGAAVPTGVDLAGGATAGSEPLSNLFAGATRGPRVILDQLWLRWDLDYRVFITAGKQHVRFGPSRFWMPTDYLHIRFRNPLDVLDARAGTTMVKAHVPIESWGASLYAAAVVEDAVATSTLGDVAGVARAEMAFGTMEIGAGAFVRAGQKPRWALDATAGFWDLDVYGELGLRHRSEIDRIRFDESATPGPVRRPQAGEDPALVAAQELSRVVESLYPAQRGQGIAPQLVLGLTYQRPYNDNDFFILGAEYFYNGLGYDSPEVYPGLVLPRSQPLAEPATFFYLGRHYGAVFLSLPAPYDWNNTTLNLSTIGNLSDQSFISRFDYIVTVVTHLSFQAFVSGRFGRTEGEFRFGVDALLIGGQSFSLPPASLDMGVALRVSI